VSRNIIETRLYVCSVFVWQLQRRFDQCFDRPSRHPHCGTTCIYALCSHLSAFIQELSDWQKPSIWSVGLSPHSAGARKIVLGGPSYSLGGQHCPLPPLSLPSPSLPSLFPPLPFPTFSSPSLPLPFPSRPFPSP